MRKHLAARVSFSGCEVFLVKRLERQRASSDELVIIRHYCYSKKRIAMIKEFALLDCMIVTRGLSQILCKVENVL